MTGKEALKNVENTKTNHIKSEKLGQPRKMYLVKEINKEEIKIIKQDLDRLEKVEKDLKQTKSNFKNSQTHSRNCYKKILDRYMALEKENAKLKKAIEILTRKKIDRNFLFYSKDVNEYNRCILTLMYHDYLTQQEYELLKEVLGNVKD